MRGDLILGQLDRDLACAIALGFVEKPQVVANPLAITVHDARMRPLGTVSDWLAGADPLDVATKEYLEARQTATQAGMKKMGQGGWAGSSAIKTREDANRKAIDAKNRGKQLLIERKTLEAARKEGLRVIE